MIITVRSLEAEAQDPAYPEEFVGRVVGRYPAGILLSNARNVRLWVNRIDITIGMVSVHSRVDAFTTISA
jgi:hypothetical protein